MPKFRKKPVVIEAHQWWQNGDHPRDESKPIGVVRGKLLREEGKVVRRYRNPLLSSDTKCKVCGYILDHHGSVETLEGEHVVCPGDFIITGVKGETYPCKPDVFEATYELVSDEE